VQKYFRFHRECFLDRRMDVPGKDFFLLYVTDEYASHVL
jgi:hypothetical protein